MDSLAERRNAAEARAAADEERAFRTKWRAARAFLGWGASQLGLEAGASSDYANAYVDAAFAGTAPAIKDKVRDDLIAHGVPADKAAADVETGWKYANEVAEHAFPR